MRVSILTSLFPNHLQPGLAPFNLHQFTQLASLCEVDVMGVVARSIGLKAAPWLAISPAETIEGISVLHPRFPSIRGVPAMNAGLLAAALIPKIYRAHRQRPMDVLLASYAYPEGCAGVLVGKALNIPVVVKCHGSDLNRAPTHPSVRLQLSKLLPLAQRVVVVSDGLRRKASELGVSDSRLRLVYNGVDRERFYVRDRAVARSPLGLDQESAIVLYVGHLADHKGTMDLVEAANLVLARRPKTRFVFVGDGPRRDAVRELERRWGRDCVWAVGPVEHDAVPIWMSAADVVCLPSWDEGMPNVVREAHACGRPVVATQVGGIPEAVHRSELGRLVSPRAPGELALALEAQLGASLGDPNTIVQMGRVLSWRESASALFEVLQESRACGTRPE